MKCSMCKGAMRHGWVITMVAAFGRVMTAPLCDDCVLVVAGAAGRRKLQNLCLDSGWTQEPLPGYEALMGRPA